MPSTTPTTLPLAWSGVRKIGKMGESISEAISANRLATPGELYSWKCQRDIAFELQP
jgi:hypothetical protein